MAEDRRLQNVKASIAAHPDFPKPGILFRDIFPVLRNPPVFKQLLDIMTEYLQSQCTGVEIIVGLESRGFLFGPILAQNLNIGFVPIRKKGKLPGLTEKVTYQLEYGEDCFEVQQDSIKPGQKVVIVDDLMATGGTMKAAFDLMETIKADVLGGLVVIELVDLKGRDKSNKPIKSLLEY
ncbi:adenine phosphoribosyltransferase-like [Haliotis rubra]|uniref:adenine phosphoribosyltransferase-like n=1 Tax=Haliotis rubra TaxID=36100 RepID=UPI001EE4EC3D|nr:adenine phosphoribosyltransferase-like [Haliotis rubra]